jgi:hypothetical protein
LINQSHLPFNTPGSSAFSTLTGGDFQEWQLGLQMNIPIGFRRELSGIRHHELLLARDRAVLKDLELEISHQLGDAIRDVDNNYGLTQTNFNRRVAAEAEVQAVGASYEAGRIALDLLLDAQRRRAEAESAYYRSLVDYNRAIMNVHYRKGSLLDFDGVYLAEGQWPAKAYFDAMRQARKRDAALYIDYGYTRPNVVSQGPVQQGCSTDCQPGGSQEIFGAPRMTPEQVLPENGVPEETLPGPGAAPPGSLPTTTNSTRIFEPARHERETHHPPVAVVATAAVGPGPERHRHGQGVWRRAAHHFS